VFPSGQTGAAWPVYDIQTCCHAKLRIGGFLLRAGKYKLHLYRDGICKYLRVFMNIAILRAFILVYTLAFVIAAGIHKYRQHL
jgi:hypothetical protein